MDPQIATEFDCQNPPAVYRASGYHLRRRERIGRSFPTLKAAKSAALRWHGDGFDVQVEGPRGAVYRYVKKMAPSGKRNVGGNFRGKYRWTR